MRKLMLPLLALVPMIAVTLPIAAMASAAPVTVATQATLAEPVGGPNQSPFSCPPGESCGSGQWVNLGHVASEYIAFGAGCAGQCDLRVEPLPDGTLVLDERTDPGSFQVPGKSYNSASSYGNPFTIQLTDTVDGALSTGRYAGGSGTLTGHVHVAGGIATITLAGDIALTS